MALQAEHDDPEECEGAPVLALFDGEFVRTVVAPIPLRGYGGTVAATGDGFAVSCPRAGGVAHFTGDGRFARFSPLADACALAPAREALRVGGEPHLLRIQRDGSTTRADAAHMAIDNHWLC